MRRRSIGLTLGLLCALAGLEAETSVPWTDSLQQPSAWYASNDAIRIADNVLLYQRSSGGWPKNVDMALPLAEGERRKVTAEKTQDDSTIDNRATYTQLRFLALVHGAGGQVRFRDSFLRGLDFLLAAQYQNGGWPQFFPLRRDYSRHITFNDDAMIGVMRLLREVASGRAPFSFVDGKRRARAAEAIERGLRVVLASQVRVGGRPTAWCAQHDEVTLEPRPARSYELVSLSGEESVGIVEYLMEIEKPSAEVVAAVEGAVAWFRAVRIDGLRVERIAAPTLPGGVDVITRPDPGAPAVWARFCEIGTNRPLFVGRDGIPRATLAEIEQERRVHYSYLGPYATDLLERRYPEWRARSGAGR